ncbi:defense protein, partial [Biomphalaria glabrata]
MALKYFILLVLSLVSKVHSHASGTGIDSACETMTPGHGAAAQVSPSPYYVDVVPNYYRPGQTVTVYIGSNRNETFRGFMVQARRTSGITSPNERFGNFTVVNNTTTACSG